MPKKYRRCLINESMYFKLLALLKDSHLFFDVRGLMSKAADLSGRCSQCADEFCRITRVNAFYRDRFYHHASGTNYCT